MMEMYDVMYDFVFVVLVVILVRMREATLERTRSFVATRVLEKF